MVEFILSGYNIKYIRCNVKKYLLSNILKTTFTQFTEARR